MSKQTAISQAISGLGELPISNSHLSIIRGYLQTLLPVDQQQIEAAYAHGVNSGYMYGSANGTQKECQSAQTYFSLTFKNTNDE
jgi:hypothetical protein